MNARDRILQIVVGGFFFFSALYIALNRESVYPLIGFAIFIGFAYIIAIIYKIFKKRIQIEKGKFSIYLMPILAFLGVIYYAGLTLYAQVPLDEKTEKNMLLVLSFAISVSIFSYLAFSLGLHDLAYQHTKEGAIKSFFLIILLILLTILIFNGLVLIVV